MPKSTMDDITPETLFEAVNVEQGSDIMEQGSDIMKLTRGSLPLPDDCFGVSRKVRTG